ncbi:MAG: hypothetical protein N3C60_03230 [Calditerrivibrio sp.]|nr:hypothetical protein [Calditerrivibrio sp.]
MALYFLQKNGVNSKNILKRFLGIEIIDFSKDNVGIPKLKVRLGISGLNISIADLKGYFYYNRELVVNNQELKLGEHVILNGIEGVLKGDIKLDVKNVELLSVNVKGDINVKSTPLGMVNVACSGTSRFSCKLASNTLSGEFSGVLKNGFLIGEFNGTVFGAEKKGERVNLSVRELLK